MRPFTLNSAALIFAAGYALSQTGDAIATQAGLTSAIVGFGLIGTATSLPELVTIIAALKLGRPEMAFGQVLGTNFVNLALIPLGDAVYRAPNGKADYKAARQFAEQATT